MVGDCIFDTVDNIMALTSVCSSQSPDIDVVLADGDPGLSEEERETRWADQIISRLMPVLSREAPPALFLTGNHDFQINRGLRAVSM